MCFVISTQPVVSVVPESEMEVTFESGAASIEVERKVSHYKIQKLNLILFLSNFRPFFFLKKDTRAQVLESESIRNLLTLTEQVRKVAKTLSYRYL